jgi:general stress protein YciG
MTRVPPGIGMAYLTDEEVAAAKAAGEVLQRRAEGILPETPPEIPSPELPEPKQHRGFATMDPERVRAYASKGGKACQAKGTGHRFTSATARIAGAKGGRNRGKGDLRGQ